MDSKWIWSSSHPDFTSRTFSPRAKIKHLWHIPQGSYPVKNIVFLKKAKVKVWHTTMRKIPHKIPLPNPEGGWIYNLPFWHFSDGYRECKIPLLSSGDLAIETHDGTKYIQFSPAWSKLQVYYNNKINYISYT